MKTLLTWPSKPGLCRVFFFSILWVPLVGFAGSFEDFFKAIELDRPADIKALLVRGFDPNTRDARDIHPLLLALQGGAFGAADALLAHPNTTPEVRNANGESALMLAALKGQLSLAQKLVARGAHVNMPGWTPLHYAATHDSKEAVKMVDFLLDNHAYIDAESPNGTTPLMMAARYGRLDVLQHLLAEGADASIKNQLGLTAADFARGSGRESDAKLIEQRLAGQPVAGVKPATQPPVQAPTPAQPTAHSQLQTQTPIQTQSPPPKQPQLPQPLYRSTTGW